MSHCCVLSSEPMTESDRSKLSKPKRTKPLKEGASPIAEDGGFGPMDYGESEEESVESTYNEASNDRVADGAEGFGDDFDDFEAGADNDDFGDFDDGFEQPSTSDEEPAETEPPVASIQSLPPSITPFVSNAPPTVRLIATLCHLHCSIEYRS